MLVRALKLAKRFWRAIRKTPYIIRRFLLYLLQEENRKLRYLCMFAGIFLVVSYAAGLLSQLIYLQVNFFSTTGEKMQSLRFWPHVVYRYAFGSGMGHLLLIAGCIAVLLYLIFHGTGITYKDDPRGFRISLRGTYGTSGWMERETVKKILKLSPPSEARGYILGSYIKDPNVMFNESTPSFYQRIKEDVVPDAAVEYVTVPFESDNRLNQNMIVYGASGSGKSYWMKLNLLQIIRAGHSVIITDPKGEMFRDMAESFRSNGYKVRVFNLLQPEYSHRWNPLADTVVYDRLTGKDIIDETLVNELCESIIANTSGQEGSDNYFDKNECTLLIMIVNYVLYLNGATFDCEKTLSYVYELLQESKFQKMLEDIKLHPNCKAFTAYSAFIGQSENNQGNTRNGLSIRLKLLNVDRFKQLLSASEISMTDPAKEKCAYFVIMPSPASSVQFLSSIFFSMTISRLELWAQNFGKEPNRCDIPVHLMLDEFCNIGQLGAQKNDFSAVVSTIRGYRISAVMIVQSLGQLYDTYGKGIAKNLMSNSSYQILLSANDDDTAAYFAWRSGKITTAVTSKRVNRSTFSITQIADSYGETEGEGSRDLIDANEIIRMREKNSNLIIVAVQGQKMLMVEAVDYRKHPMAAEMQSIPIWDYMNREWKETGKKPPVLPAAPATEPEETAPAAAGKTPESKPDPKAAKKPTTDSGKRKKPDPKAAKSKVSSTKSGQNPDPYYDQMRHELGITETDNTGGMTWYARASAAAIEPEIDEEAPDTDYEPEDDLFPDPDFSVTTDIPDISEPEAEAEIPAEEPSPPQSAKESEPEQKPTSQPKSRRFDSGDAALAALMGQHPKKQKTAKTEPSQPPQQGQPEAETVGSHTEPSAPAQTETKPKQASPSSADGGQTSSSQNEQKSGRRKKNSDSDVLEGQIPMGGDIFQ